jgi:hypothetical protein
MSASADCPVHPFQQSGLQLVDGPVPEALNPRAGAGAEQGAALTRLGAFHWGLLAGFVTLQLAYCVALVQLARWAVGHWIGA